VDVPTYGFVLDVSRLGMARLEEPAPIKAIRAGNWEKHTKDALIAATAQYEGLILVTEERRLTNFARRELKLTVWDWPRLYAHLQTL
jgi:predicted nucleic acid-binding protein